MSIQTRADADSPPRLVHYVFYQIESHAPPGVKAGDVGG